jgi:hypothetical protein
MLQRSSKSIYRPNGDEVELTASGGFQESIEGRATIATLGSADTVVAEGSHDVPSPSGGDTLKLVELVVGGLVSGGDSKIECGLHGDLVDCINLQLFYPSRCRKLAIY